MSLKWLRHSTGMCSQVAFFFFFFFFFFQIHLHQGMNIKFGTASALFDIFFFLVSHISF